jgi:hypothetical protein
MSTNDSGVHDTGVLEFPLAENRQDFESPRIVPGRACGSCSLCCKLPQIDELEKPVGKWCIHCTPGRGGCTIYERRPKECRKFYCSWMFTPELGPEWQPTTAKMFILQETSEHIAVYVDPGSPTAWRREPYYSQLKAWARVGADRGTQIVVYIKNNAIAILPNKEVDLGTYNVGDSLIVRQINTPHGRDFEALLARSDDVRSPEQQKERARLHPRPREIEIAGA